MGTNRYSDELKRDAGQQIIVGDAQFGRFRSV